MDALSTLMAALGLPALGLFMFRLARNGRWPRMPVVIPGFDYAGKSQAKARQGGDYHDIFVPPGKASVAVVVGDVAGHDSVAARLMEIAGKLLRARPLAPGKLGPWMGNVNRDLAQHMHAGRFMTLFLAVMVGETRSIHWVSAGHGPVIAYDPVADRFNDVPGHDIPLGIDPDWNYHEQDHTGWAKGALLVVGTDGIWETRNPAGEMYGKDRFKQVVYDSRQFAARVIVDAVYADMKAFRQGRPAGDDVTLVVVKAV